MILSIHIPIWLMWVLGIPIGIMIIVFAIIGIMFVWSFKDGIF
jgi:hypothetical protein